MITPAGEKTSRWPASGIQSTNYHRAKSVVSAV
jgi:hypothetical protein